METQMSLLMGTKFPLEPMSSCSIINFIKMTQSSKILSCLYQKDLRILNKIILIFHFLLVPETALDKGNVWLLIKRLNFLNKRLKSHRAKPYFWHEPCMIHNKNYYVFRNAVCALKIEDLLLFFNESNQCS